MIEIALIGLIIWAWKLTRKRETEEIIDQQYLQRQLKRRIAELEKETGIV
jgi:hypothetical protein